LIIALFFPYNLSPLLGLNGYLANTVDILFYLLKLFIVIIFSITLIRVGVARLKIDQVVYTYWIPLTLIGLIGLVLLMMDARAFIPLGW
ncbi:MAG: NADH-quinone oxidoreductase subunit H, partial [Thermoplasmata archaeon]